MMNSKLHTEILDVNWNNTESVIKFYEKNLIYFRNYNEKDDLKAIEEVAEIKLSYIQALDKKKHYTKATECLKEVDVLIQRLKGSEFHLRSNERYMFESGVIAHRLEKIEESQSYFSQLIKNDPDNDLYKKWYDANKEWMLCNQIKFIGYFGVGLFLLNMVGDTFGYYSHDLSLKLDLFAAFLIIVGFWGVRIRNYFKKL